MYADSDADADIVGVIVALFRSYTVPPAIYCAYRLLLLYLCHQISDDFSSMSSVRNFQCRFTKMRRKTESVGPKILNPGTVLF